MHVDLGCPESSGQATLPAPLLNRGVVRWINRVFSRGGHVDLGRTPRPSDAVRRPGRKDHPTQHAWQPAKTALISWRWFALGAAVNLEIGVGVGAAGSDGKFWCKGSVVGGRMACVGGKKALVGGKLALVGGELAVNRRWLAYRAHLRR